MGERIVGGVADGDAYIQISIKDGAIRLETGTGQQKISWLIIARLAALEGQFPEAARGDHAQLA